LAKSIEVDGLHHGGMPIPSASRRGPLVASGGISGLDRSTGELADGIEHQLDRLFENIEAVIEAAGGSINDIVKITFSTGDQSTRSLINERWTSMFPVDDRRPARHILARELRAGMLVQADFLAYVETTER
jgi:enamine deaminase RidA (YjgF/YER057c/UK114 family)